MRPRVLVRKKNPHKTGVYRKTILTKEELLDTCLFKDCAYLDMYVNIINSNLGRENFLKTTQRHKIIPKEYLNILGLENEPENIAILPHKDKIICCILVVMCTIDNDDLRATNKQELLASIARAEKCLEFKPQANEFSLADIVRFIQEGDWADGVRESIDTLTATKEFEYVINMAKEVSKRKSKENAKRLSEKFKITRRGEGNPFYGHTNTEESNRLRSEAAKRRVYVLKDSVVYNISIDELDEWVKNGYEQCNPVNNIKHVLERNLKNNENR